MDWLTEQVRRVQEQKLKQEKTIQYLKQLYKPWPAEKESDRKSQEQLSGDNTASVQSKDVSDTCLTAEEKEGLQLMDQLLSKAQRARDVQKKLEESKKRRVKDTEQNKAKRDSATKTQQNSNFNKNEAKAVNEAKVLNENTTKDTSKSGPAGKLELSKRQDASSAKPGSGTKQLNRGIATSSSKTSERTEKSRVSHRPQSSSGQRKVVPAHASAPFQTNPSLASAKLQTTYRASTVKTFSKSRSAGPGARSRVKEGKGASVIEKVPDSNSNFKTLSEGESKERRTDLKDSVETNENKTVCDTINTNQNSTHTEEKLRGGMKNDGCKLQENFQAVTIDDDLVEDKNTSCQGTESKHSAKLFDLKKDGASLVVPNKLKKLMYKNRKLRQKLYTQNVTQKVNSPQPSAEFPEHLQRAFGDEDARETQLQAKQAQHIVQTYNSLLQLLNSLHLDHISADSDPADIYYCKKMVEYILLTFQEMEENLHTTDFRTLSSAVIYSGCPVPKLPVTEPSSMAVWYDKNTFTGCCSPAPVYQYHSCKQLETYMTLVYKVQLLQLQTDVMDTVARLLLPLLQTLDPGTSEFAQVLRASYSLLSTNKNRMPVVVRDTIQEDSVIQEEDQLS